MLASKKKAMPKWLPAPPELIATFEKALAPFPDAERRKMFGYPCAFMNGQMFTGLFQDTMMLRLSESDRATFLRQPGASTFEPMAGRPMREYVIVPDDVLRSANALKDWLERSQTYAKSLPQKSKKVRAARLK